MRPTLDLELVAEPVSAARSRRAVTEWLGSLCGPGALCDTGQDLVLAVNEAISNSVEHAYAGGPGTVTLRASARIVRGTGHRGECTGLEVRIEIRDHGRWRDPPVDPGYRGRGLQMARASVDRLGIEHTQTGTVVTLWRALGCPLDAGASAGRRVSARPARGPG